MFVEDALATVQENGEILPSFVKPADMEKDMDLYRRLDGVVIRVSQLGAKLRDTQMLAGSEAYSNALSVYKMFGMAAEAGLPGAQPIYERLRARFERPGSADADQVPETPENDAPLGELPVN